ncbi:ABC transporter substrate-binding protein [Fodinicurvata fenggangensis]|uniref:ABC transporter substrate-binding protein n=1 Tax=Fodinicurvata fenggangensis TaxID=1121830 RepID=UPI0006895934|nr:ABC transporter substrate-binding protein [Fodinicurvata fenggangensis]
MKRPEAVPALVLGLLLVPAVGLAAEDETLTVVSWGGVYEESQRIAYFDPFEEETGVEVKVVQYEGELSDLRAELENGETEWDVIDLVSAHARRGCSEGLLRPIDPDILPPAPDGTPAREDFIEGALLPCAVVQLVFSTVVAYDERAFPGEKPTKIEDLFDTERFPGKRALRKMPGAILEWALLSYGVPRSQLYDLLSTRRGMDLAFRQLQDIREDIVWWQDPSEPARLLAEGEVAMASGFNGRFFEERTQGSPISIIWDNQILDYDAWAIPANSDQPELAEQFIAFATRPERMAEQVRHIPYGPSRHSAMRHLGLDERTLAPITSQLPTAEHHLGTAIWEDSEWYARTEAFRQRLFDNWLAEGDPFTDSEGGS